ncbi:MAG: hypothetical protein M3Q81_04680 [bacterium]|nr:hypothetical protein [bacterium]
MLLNHTFDIVKGRRLTLIVKGRPGQDANIEFSLILEFVTLPDGRWAMTLHESCQVPVGIEITYLQTEDVVILNGTVYWLAGMNGMCLHFEGDVYQIAKLLSVDDIEGTIYFTHLPKELGGDGEIWYDLNQWNE